MSRLRLFKLKRQEVKSFTKRRHVGRRWMSLEYLVREFVVLGNIDEFCELGWS